MTDEKLKNSEVLAVYRPSAANQLFAFGGLVVILLFMIPENIQEFNNTVFLDPGAIFGMILIGLLYLGLVWLFLHVITQDKLILYETGFECWYTGTHYTYSWDDMQEFTLNHSDNNTDWGILMNDNEFIPIDHFVGLPVFHANKKTHQRKLRRFAKTRAGKLFHTYAPHLFNELKQKK
ncbi:MAG: hypothetical protein ACPG7F_04610 [Aggregatilineales bacterium]